MSRYEKGDYVKVVFEGEGTNIGETMWVQVDSCDEANSLVFGRLDNEPVSTKDLKLGQQLAVRFDRIVEHRKPWEFVVN